MRLSPVSSPLLLLALGHLPACQPSHPPAATGASAPANSPAAAGPRTAGTGATEPSAREAPQQTGPVVEFSRTACYGTCPDFTARFYADGRMEYEGRQFAPVQGNREVAIDPAIVRELLQEAERIGFYGMRDVYSNGTLDIPSTFLSVTTPKATKRVQVDENGPEELTKLFARLDLEVRKALGVIADR